MKGPSVPAAIGNLRAFFPLALLIGVAVFGGVASGSARAAPGDEKLTIYAVAATAQFINHADDRVRGMSTNPFNVKSQALVIITKGKEKKYGPFPGDDVLYSFKLYTGVNRKKAAGSAMFTCYYNFIRRATCHSYFELNGGIVLASGSVPFNSTRFTLSITGGTKDYVGARGEVAAAPAANNAQRLDLRLIDLVR
jgi:hypothetical protein